MAPNIKIPQLNNMLQRLARDKNVFYLDYFSAMSDNRNGLPKELADDGVHPTTAGYEIMAELANKTIQMAIKS